MAVELDLAEREKLALFIRDKAKKGPIFRFKCTKEQICEDLKTACRHARYPIIFLADTLFVACSKDQIQKLATELPYPKAERDILCDSIKQEMGASVLAL